MTPTESTKSSHYRRAPDRGRMYRGGTWGIADGYI
nr:MAG TPA: hypothetical protein [Caudoviricetes sp.]